MATARVPKPEPETIFKKLILNMVKNQSTKQQITISWNKIKHHINSRYGYILIQMLKKIFKTTSKIQKSNKVFITKTKHEQIRIQRLRI